MNTMTQLCILWLSKPPRANLIAIIRGHLIGVEELLAILWAMPLMYGPENWHFLPPSDPCLEYPLKIPIKLPICLTILWALSLSVQFISPGNPGTNLSHPCKTQNSTAFLGDFITKRCVSDVAKSDVDRKSAPRSFGPCRFEQSRTHILGRTNWLNRDCVENWRISL